ncbi:MAG: hypothetical protein KGM99_15190 [Burkholderiales bacterium]|nr:hypothetical protein [Burkholderiales bacterium]
MNPKDIFNLAVRLFGLYFLFLAISSVAVIFSGISAGFSMRAILTAAFFIGIGWWMLGGASLLLQRAYPTEDSQQTNTEVNGEVSYKTDL